MKKTNINHIEEYFADNTNDKSIVSKELFKNKDIELRTELNDDEIKLISALKHDDRFLKIKRLNVIYVKFLNDYMSLKVSKDRQSRKEFVKLNSNDDTDETINKLGSLSNILNVRK